VTESIGKKKALQAIEAEAYREIMSGMAPATLAEFAAQLLDWLRNAHPDAPLLTLATIESQISQTWHRRHELIRGGD
jgi:hypothetical protein